MKIKFLMIAVLCASSGVSQIKNVAADMRWRLVGPYRAGWATVADGIPGSPNTLYFGSAGGGVWKTIDAGRTWQPLLQHETASSIGALAIAPSDPQVIYAGTGQVTTRYDIMAGDGVYRSGDGGETWRHVGLEGTKHIGKILIDPNNSSRVLVAAMGNVFTPNPDRGVYLTIDGGQSWKHVLSVDDTTGAVDLAWDPEHPQVVYAALWSMQHHPWLDYFQPKIGVGSGIYKSQDGGEHWERLENGLPKGPLGRIGLAVARGSGGNLIYATIAASGKGSGLYSSHSGGKDWQYMNQDGGLANAYFSMLTVHPIDSNTVYVMGRSISRSIDGGAHFRITTGAPGGDDYHYLWINPSDPMYMIEGSDQGASVSVDGGKSWSSWYNQPTGQFYHIAIDDRFPYRIYSGQQDNGTVEIASRGPYGVIEERDWHPVGGDERDYMVPKPGNPDLVFGSGLGGTVSRFDEITRQSASVAPWPISSYGAYPPSVKYRYTWITPLVFSPIGKHALYEGSQYLFRSLDDGNHWETISPDLSGKASGSHTCQNPDPVTARDCGFGVIFTIAPSPYSEKEIWIGTDDGLIQMTKDEGAHWKNVTPNTIPPWGLVAAIDQSRSHTTYAAIDLHRLGKFEPSILKTTDEGKTWQTIVNGIPANEYTTVVKADPEREGLLYAGTNRSMYVSFNNGEQWQPLAMNLPTTWIRDLVVHHDDLVIATQGRGIWVLDDVEPLREASTMSMEKSAYLFHPADAWRLRKNENRDTPPPPSTPLGQNPPAGAVIDYWLKDGTTGGIKITINDSAGNIVRSFTENSGRRPLPSSRYFEEGWLGSADTLAITPGMHRFVWDLRYERPPAIEYDYSIAAVWRDGTPLNPEGALVLPGKYTVTLEVNGEKYSQKFSIKLDPRVHVAKDALVQQLRTAREIDTLLRQSVGNYKTFSERLKNDAANLTKEMTDSLSALTNGGGENFAGVSGVFAGLATGVQSADAAPTQGQKAVLKEYRRQLADLMTRWKNIQKMFSPESGQIR